MRLSAYKNKRNIILPIVLVSSIILVRFLDFFTQTANQIQELAIVDSQTNAKIEVYSISNSLSNAISAISSNLELIANSPSAEGNISKIQTMLNIGRDSTRNLTDGYYFLDNNGRLVTFTGIEKEENANYRGMDLGHRDCFQIPKQSETLYISTVIDSNDNVPRIYISFPILESNQTRVVETVESERKRELAQSNSNSNLFKGVIVATIAAKTLGNFLEGQIHPEFDGDITFIDRNHTIIYTQNQTFIGKGYFGDEFQSYVKSILQNKNTQLNNITNRALNIESGLDEFNFENTSTTIAYEALKGPRNNIESIYNDSIGTLFITVPHTLAADVASLINNEKITNFSIIALIAALATIISLILLRWNKTLQQVVNQKTSQLRELVDNLRKANEELKLHDKMQKEFINIAAHELRTPSQAISGNLEFIEMAYLPSLLSDASKEEQNTFNVEFENLAKDKDRLQDFKSSLVSTYRNSERLQNLVNNILDVSRIEINKLETHREYFNLNEKIKNLIRDIYSNSNTINLSPNSSQKNIIIDFEPSEEPLIVFADKVRIYEVLVILISNAIKFSKDKPITISVKKIQKNTLESNQYHNNSKVTNKNSMKENRDEIYAVVSIRDG